MAAAGRALRPCSRRARSTRRAGGGVALPPLSPPVPHATGRARALGPSCAACVIERSVERMARDQTQAQARLDGHTVTGPNGA